MLPIIRYALLHPFSQSIDILSYPHTPKFPGSSGVDRTGGGLVRERFFRISSFFIEAGRMKHLCQNWHETEGRRSISRTLWTKHGFWLSALPKRCCHPPCFNRGMTAKTGLEPGAWARHFPLAAILLRVWRYPKSSSTPNPGSNSSNQSLTQPRSERILDNRRVLDRKCRFCDRISWQFQ